MAVLLAQPAFPIDFGHFLDCSLPEPSAKAKWKEYNGWIMLEINHLKTLSEVEKLKRKISAYPQTLFTMMGGDGHSIVFVVPYTRPDGSLPQTRNEAELFHANAYRHALKTFEPRIG